MSDITRVSKIEIEPLTDLEGSARYMLIISSASHADSRLLDASGERAALELHTELRNREIAGALITKLSNTQWLSDNEYITVEAVAFSRGLII